MSRELSATLEGSGATLYAQLRRVADDAVWNGTAFETPDDTHIGTYAIPLAYRGLDEYAADMPAAVPAGTYRYRVYQQLAGSPATTDDILKTTGPFAWSGASIGVPVPSGGWRYSDRAHVVAMLANESVRVIWDLDGDETEDAGAMEQDGILSDGWIDGKLAVNGITVRVVIASQPAYIQQMFADIGAHMTVWYGFHRRGLEEMSGRGVGSAKDIAGLMSGYLEYAKEQMAELVTILQRIDTDDSVLPSGSLAGAITAVVGAPKQYPGTGCVRPAAFVVPSFPSGIGSW
jgi:hypothetical protein